jgi:hypothetical protein
MNKTALVKRRLKDLEKDINQRGQVFIRQSEPTAGKLLYWMATRSIYVIIAVLAAVGWYIWNNRDESQFNIVFFESFELAKLTAVDSERFENIEAWLRAIVISGKSYEALEAARKIKDAAYRSQAMVIVAEAMIKNREAGKAESALNEAQRAAQQATNDSEKSTRLAAVAAGLAKLHHYRLARETANLCASSSNKLAAYTAILRAYLIKRNPNLEKLFEEDNQE